MTKAKYNYIFDIKPKRKPRKNKKEKLIARIVKAPGRLLVKAFDKYCDYFGA